MKYCFLITITLLLLSCSKITDYQLENRFNEILQNTGEDELFLNSITAESKRYINQLIQMSDNLDYNKAENLGFKTKHGLVTMKIHGLWHKYFSGEEADIHNMLNLMRLTETGILNMFAKHKFKYQELHSLEGNKANVHIIIPISGNKVFQTTYVFEKEEGEWMLNLMSTFSLEEKILTQFDKKQVSLTRQEVMQKYIEENGSSIEVKYDRNKSYIEKK